MYSTPRLSDEQVQGFRKEGYLLYRSPVLPARSFDKLKQHFEHKLLELPGDVRPEAMDVPHFTDTRLFDWLFAPEILDLVEPIIGPDIALFSSHFISKPKGDGKRVPWHEDSHYWKGMIDPIEVVTVWLAIDPSTRENGCMYVIPRTHLEPDSDYEPVDPSLNYFPDEVSKGQQRERFAVACELNPNEASLHDGRLMHGSPPNTSAIRRTGYTMRYMSTRVRYLGGKSDLGHDHQIYLARGRDHARNRYADPSREYPELARYRTKRGGH